MSTRASSISGMLGTGGTWVLNSIVNMLARFRVNPNVLTLIGLVINIFAAVLFAKGMFTVAGLVVLFAGIFDMVDGEVARRTGAEARYVHGQDVEKRANALALLEGRGRSAVADVTVPRALVAEVLRTTPEDLAAIGRSYAVGFAQLVTQNWTVQAANGLAAVLLACGQDVAYLTECASGHLDLEVDRSGDLYAAVTLPSLLVGTVGGGSGQGTARECLRLLGCEGSGGADTFAEILAATVLAGDLSLMGAFCAHEFVAAHERLGRNRPPAGPSGGNAIRA